ncbi:glyoxylate/hydroxypyruvate reductase A [Loktanella sp. D2R18]|uniref:2-hydroxyacid dehydrogenase n=1 Tax=Rhodobacterales TaxID=204455 RepID=UPI000DE88989|nr:MULTISPECIES: glyoxylate/hydroxypyruvate reductase A [Rhodobacterales]MDO6588648.1 glyoxylate/hydroxypyruvate reductase A [Yoonia sp. 1_MG-2023]RBW42103.1 glyoxylate/hydroxypyruvate reductase A [Loktanella sp. D2R18]
MINILFAATDDLWDDYETALKRALETARVTADLRRDHRAETTDYIIFGPGGPVDDFTPFTRCKAVLNLWAGVEKITQNKTLTQPLCRMVDPSLTHAMVDWVVGHTMRHHLGMDAHIHGQDGIWRNDVYPPIAADRPVAILGIGALGAACGQALHQLGFPVTGWSRSPKNVPNLHCLHGDDGLDKALSGAQIVILLLPMTAQTENTLNAARLALLAPGAFIINPGRGPLIDDAALLAALETGQVAHATLDVFRIEPLPQDHVFWGHPQVTVTPHIAATTRPETAAKVIANNIAGHENGAPLQNRVDRGRGY